MSIPLSKAHEAIGRAVWMCQTFETVVVVCIELVRRYKQIVAGEKVDGLIDRKRFKVATTNLMKELLSSNDIDPVFKSRIDSLLDRRHTLVHRWFLENGWPGDDDTVELERIFSFAVEIETEAREITQALLSSVVRWASRGFQGQEEEMHARREIVQLFKNAHFGLPGSGWLSHQHDTPHDR